MPRECRDRPAPRQHQPNEKTQEDEDL
nr:unnamed protein product [Callosobruchus chinensis]